MTCKNHPWCDL